MRSRSSGSSRSPLSPGGGERRVVDVDAEERAKLAVAEGGRAGAVDAGEDGLRRRCRYRTLRRHPGDGGLGAVGGGLWGIV